MRRRTSTLLLYAMIAWTSSCLVEAFEATPDTENIKRDVPQKVTGAVAPGSGDNNSNYVFLQKFPLMGSDNLFFHTEVLVCPHDGFSAEDQQFFDDKIGSLQDFAELDEEWWKDKTSNCIELGYGGASCSEECCGVPHGSDQTNYPLNAHRAMISNADASKKSLYLYGTGAFDGNVAYHHVCDHKCWSNWAGSDYNPLTNNCNTFTSTVLACVYGLSQKKPHLGPSDMVTVTCDCSVSKSDEADKATVATA